MARPPDADRRDALRAQPILWALIGTLYFVLDQGRNVGTLAPAFELVIRSAVWAGVGMAVSSGLLVVFARLRPPLRAAGAAIGVPAGAFAWLVIFAAIDAGFGLEEGFVPPWAWPTEQLFFEFGDYVLSLLAWAGAVAALAARGREQAAETALAEAEALQRRAQIDALEQQLSPHFLFNSLNSATALVHDDPDLAEQVLTDLAELLRLTLEVEPGRPWTLAQDIEIARRGLRIEGVRFADTLEVTWAIAPGIGETRVPALATQGLVANAVKHGRRDAGVLQIHVAGEAHGDAVRLTVSNTGRLGAPRAAGRGLRILEAQLERIPGGTLRLEERDGHVIATLEVPR